METVVAVRERLRAPVAEIVKQAARVVQLGHDLHLAPDTAVLLHAGASN
jgi:hypothetical protein